MEISNSHSFCDRPYAAGFAAVRIERPEGALFSGKPSVFLHPGLAAALKLGVFDHYSMIPTYHHSMSAA